MAKTVKLLLTENVDNLGIVGDIVNVRIGYARNFLLPRDYATTPSDEMLAQLAEKRKQAEKEVAALRSHRGQLIQKIDGLELTLTRACNDQGHLYGFDNSIRSIHLSPDAPAVDVYVGSPWVYRSVGPELSFGDASEFYPSLPDYDLLTVVPNGTTGDELLFGEPTIFFQDSDLDLPGGCYTTVVYDNAANLDVVVLEDDYSPIPRGLIRLRAFHAAPSVGQVDLYDVTIPGAPVLVEEDLDFGNAGAVLELPAEAFSLGLDVDDDGRADLVFDVPELAEGSVVNAFASEDAAGDIAIIAQLDGGTAVRIDPR